MSDELAVRCGQALRYVLGGRLIFCGERAYFVGANGPDPIPARNVPLVLEEMARAAAEALHLTRVPNFSGAEREAMKRAGSFLCTGVGSSGQLCPECYQRDALRPLLKGKTLAEAKLS